MTTETMTIHQALAELKMLDKKIKDAINNGVFVYYKLTANEDVRGQKVSAFCDRMAADYQSIKDMMARFNAIKRAVIQSNAVTTVAVGKREYYVAEAIAMKSAYSQMLRTLRDTVSRQYASVTASVENNNTKAMAAAEKAAYEIAKPTDNTEVDPKVVENLIKVTAAPKLQDVLTPTGIDVASEIDKLTEALDAFVVNVDAALSTSNALTKIEVTYDSSDIA